MLIDLRALLSGTQEELTVSAPLEMEVFETAYASYDIVEKQPVQLNLVKTGRNKLTVNGSGSVTLDIPCDRCLEPVATPICFTIEKTLELDEQDQGDEPEEKDYIDGYNLDVDKLVFGEILLSIPGKTLCKEDCKGLCPQCGANLNIAECGCDRTSLDPRMSVFKDILNNFKEV